jgi:hypothetical protein
MHVRMTHAMNCGCARGHDARKLGTPLLKHPLCPVEVVLAAGHNKVPEHWGRRDNGTRRRAARVSFRELARARADLAHDRAALVRAPQEVRLLHVPQHTVHSCGVH